MKLPEPHRIARQFYGPRVIGFGLAFVASVVLVYQDFLVPGHLVFAALLLLVYPHAAYLHACFARHKKQAELNHLFLDAFLLGAWTAVVQFNIGLSFALLSSVSMNNAMLGGLRRLGLSLLAFATGAGLLGATTGFEFRPFESFAVTVVGLLSVLIYFLLVGLLFYRQNGKLLVVLNENKDRRQLFQSLAAAGLASTGAKSLEELLDICLAHLQEVLPPKRRFGIVVRDRVRTGVVHCSAFLGFTGGDQQALIAQAQRVERDGNGRRAPGDRENGLPLLQWQFIGAAGTRIEALFVAADNLLDPAEARAVDIFLQQLAASLEKHALTLRLEELANTDALTGLANRARLDVCLAAAIRRSQRSASTGFSLIVVDIDGLKVLNDSRGHEAGDRLIVATAQLLRSACRETDVVTRSGGDEFVVLCPATTCASAAPLIERLRRRMGEQTVLIDGADGLQETIRIHFSLGCADSSECPASDVLKLADQRMYAQKKAYHASLG